MASTLTDMMVCTASYWMALPALRELSAEAATCSKVATCLCCQVQRGLRSARRGRLHVLASAQSGLHSPRQELSRHFDSCWHRQGWS